MNSEKPNLFDISLIISHNMRYNVYKYNVVELMSMKTCKQLSSEWGVTEHTIADLCRKGKISGAVKEGKSWNEYYGAAEPPVRCGESHLSGLTEPLRFLR